MFVRKTGVMHEHIVLINVLGKAVGPEWAIGTHVTIALVTPCTPVVKCVTESSWPEWAMDTHVTIALLTPFRPAYQHIWA